MSHFVNKYLKVRTARKSYRFENVSNFQIHPNFKKRQYKFLKNYCYVLNQNFLFYGIILFWICRISDSETLAKREFTPAILFLFGLRIIHSVGGE